MIPAPTPVRDGNAPVLGRHTMDRPNILLLMSDQQRWDTLGCYGCSAIPTPALDGLAANGVVFERCYVNVPICTPSRACMLTGRLPAGHGVYRIHDTLPADQVLLPEHLAGLGYETALVGKLHVSGRAVESVERHPHDGFQRYEWSIDPQAHLDSPFNAHVAWLRERHPEFLRRLQAGRQDHHPAAAHFSTWAAERAIAFLSERDRARPFFLNVSLFDPHGPYFDYPLEAGELVDHSRMAPVRPLTAAHRPIPSGVAREREAFHAGQGRSRKPGQQDITAIRRGYLASIAFLDRQVGRIFAELERLDLMRDTLILFVSDHGDMIGDLELIAKGAFFYDPCTRVPLIVRLPGAERAGARLRDLVQPHDLAATLLRAAGMPAAEVAALMPQSQDLAALARGGGPPARDHAVTLYRNSGIGPDQQQWEPPIYASMFHDGRYKLTLYQDPAARRGPEGELYDMDEDPQETTNLWSAHRHAARRDHLIHRLSAALVAGEVQHAAGRGGTSWPYAHAPR